MDAEAPEQDASLDPDEQAMLEKLLKKGYKLEKKPPVAEPDAEEQAMLEKLAKKGYAVKGKPSAGEASAADDPEVQAELSKRAAARSGGSTSGKPKTLADADVDVDLELQRRADRRKQEL